MSKIESSAAVLSEGDNVRSWQAAPVLQLQGEPRIQFTNSPVKKFERRSVLIADLGDARLVLKAPIPVHLEDAGSEVLGYSYDLDEFEVADDEWSVIQKMRSAIARVYFTLKEEQGNLGPLMQQHWAFLQKVVSET